MTISEKHELVNALEALFDLDRFAGCSPLFFKQVFTQKIKAIQAGGYREKLIEEIEQERMV